MAKNREEKNARKHQSFDMKRRDQEEDTKETFMHKSHKEMRQERKNYNREMTEEMTKKLELFLQEYAELSPVRMQYKMKCFTVPDYDFFIKSPEEFLENRPHFGDIFEGRSRKVRWIRQIISQSLGADEVEKFLDSLDDGFLEAFLKLQNKINFSLFEYDESKDLKDEIYKFILNEINNHSEK